MTYEEAIKFLDEHCTAKVIPLEVKIMCSKALEKQIPLKPTRVDNCGNVSISERCCKCYEIIDCMYSYCPYCGQAIDKE